MTNIIYSFFTKIKDIFETEILNKSLKKPIKIMVLLCEHEANDMLVLCLQTMCGSLSITAPLSPLSNISNV